MAKPFVIAMKEFFGYKPNQTLKEFSEELKLLTPADKLEFAEGLRTQGLDVSNPVELAVA